MTTTTSNIQLAVWVSVTSSLTLPASPASVVCGNFSSFFLVVVSTIVADVHFLFTTHRLYQISAALPNCELLFPSPSLLVVDQWAPPPTANWFIVATRGRNCSLNSNSCSQLVVGSTFSTTRLPIWMKRTLLHQSARKMHEQRGRRWWWWESGSMVHQFSVRALLSTV